MGNLFGEGSLKMSSIRGNIDFFFGSWYFQAVVIESSYYDLACVLRLLVVLDLSS